jgi:hypothetical protein
VAQAAETALSAVAIPSAVVIPVAIVVAVAGLVAIIPAAVKVAAVTINIGESIVAVPIAYEVPAPWDPIAIGHVAGRPGVSRPRARRNIGHRPANIDSKLGCLGGGRSKPKPAGNDCCCKHPIPYAAHCSSIPSLVFKANRFAFRLRL